MNQFLKKLFKHPVVLDEEGTSRLNICVALITASYSIILIFHFLPKAIVFNDWPKFIGNFVWFVVVIFLLYKIQSGSNKSRIVFIIWLIIELLAAILAYAFIIMGLSLTPTITEIFRMFVSIVAAYNLFYMFHSNVKAELKARKDAANKINTTTEMES